MQFLRGDGGNNVGINPLDTLTLTFIMFVSIESKYFDGAFLSSTAHQFLRFGKGVLTNFQKFAILTTHMKTQHGVYAV